MPNSFFEPIIGSGFDAIAAQRANWAGFNQNVDTANIARANAAEQNVNNWMAQVQQLRDQATIRDMALRQQAEAEQTRRGERAQDIALGSQQWKEQMAEKAKQTEAVLGAQRMQLAKQEADLENKGRTAAANYLLKKSVVDKAQADADAAREALAAASDAVKTEQAKPLKEQLNLSSLKTAETQATKAKAHADTAFLNAQTAWQRFEVGLENDGFRVNEDTGHVEHTPTGKKWSFRAAVKAAALTGPSGPASFTGDLQPVDETSQLRPWEGFSGSSSMLVPPPEVPVASPIAAPPARNAFQVGRFTVTPR